jgi:hypothetical protein
MDALFNHSFTIETPWTTVPAGSPAEGSPPDISHPSSSTIDFELTFPELQNLLPPIDKPNTSSSHLDLLLTSDFDIGVSGPLLLDQITEVWDQTDENTTLCSIAYRLVFQCNRRGLGETELHIRMNHGFQKGKNPMEGCRIDNKVLLAVLAEIS